MHESEEHRVLAFMKKFHHGNHDKAFPSRSNDEKFPSFKISKESKAMEKYFSNGVFPTNQHPF